MEALAAGLLRPKQVGAGQPTPLIIEVVSVDPIRVLALRNVGAYAELNRTYARLFELVLAQVSPEALAGIYGVPHDDPMSAPPGYLRFDAGLAVGSEGQPEGELKELELGSGSYARIRHVGDYDKVHETIDAAYAATVISLDRALDARPMFIHYLHDPEETPEPDLEADVYVPLV
jgi:AraC family transcriptional regulator